MYACMHEGVYQSKQVYTGHALPGVAGSCKYTRCAVKHEGVYQVNSTITTLYSVQLLISDHAREFATVMRWCGDWLVW